MKSECFDGWLYENQIDDHITECIGRHINYDATEFTQSGSGSAWDPFNTGPTTIALS